MLLKQPGYKVKRALECGKKEVTAPLKRLSMACTKQVLQQKPQGNLGIRDGLGFHLVEE